MRLRTIVIMAAVLSVVATGCGSSGSSKTAEAKKGCSPATGGGLVVLTDDKKLQTVDNVIPAINAAKANDTLIGALNKVSDALTTDKLVALNKKTDVERKTPKVVAEDFVKSESLDQGLSGGSGAIAVGSGNFSESETLANIYADVLKAAGYQSSVQAGKSRESYLPALIGGETDVVPEYVGTLTEIINKNAKFGNGPNATPKASGDLDATVSALTQLGEKNGLKFGKPSPAADQNAFAVTKAFADKNGLKTLSDVAAKCNGGTLVLGGGPECKQRPFCKPGLESKYGIKFSGFTTLDVGGPLTKTALKKGKVQIGLVFSSDGSLG